MNRHFGWIAAGIAVAILYGSFYPFGFYAHHDPRGPLGELLASGFHGSRDDVVANIFLYIPFGFFAACAFGRRIAAATLAGFALSLAVELIQFYDAGRYQELTDIASNTLGALLGAGAAIVFRRRDSSVYVVLLLSCWCGSRVFPVSPPASSIAALDVFRLFAGWLAVGLMIEAIGVASRVALPLCLIAALLVRGIGGYFEPAELAGGVAAALLWSCLLWRVHARAVTVTALFTALVVLLALAPFHFSATPRAFGWIPFRSFLESPTQTALRVFFEKAFYYGGLIWLFARAGLSIGAAAALGALMVLGLRLLQVYLPGRSAEITDACLLLMLAAMMKLISLAEKSSQENLPESA